MTNPERYQILHSAGQALVDRLCEEFLVEQLEGIHYDESLSYDVDTERLVRLVPAAEGAAPITIILSRFPGLLVRFGEWHVEAYPACGCDACDEDPSELVDKLHEQVNDLVTGQFSETIGKGRKTWLSFQPHDADELIPDHQALQEKATPPWVPGEWGHSLLGREAPS